MMHAEFHRCFGKLANVFAGLEADVRRLIAGMVFDDDNVTASLFLDASSLKANLDLLIKLSRQHSEYEEQIKEIVDSIRKRRLSDNESLVDTRNLFIHGIWVPNSFSEEDGFALVMDLKTKFETDGSEKIWRTGQGRKYSKSEFSEIQMHAQRVMNSIHFLSKELEEAGVCTFPFRSSVERLGDNDAF